MKKQLLVFSLGVVAVFSLASCSQKPQASSASQAIEQSQTLKTPEEQSKYLLSQANSFVNSKNFDQAIETAKYILANLDQNSQEAKNIIEKAMNEMKQMAQQKAEELKKSLGNLGK